MLRKPLTYLLGAALAVSIAVPASAAPQAESRDRLAAKPYMGWSSWSIPPHGTKLLRVW